MASESDRPQPVEHTPEPTSTPGEGTLHVGCTLTDAEREAISNAILELDGILAEFIPTPVEVRIRRDVRTLRGLLERLT